MNRNAAIACVIAVVAVIVAAVALALPSEDRQPQEVADAVELSSYSEGIYDGVLTDQGLTLASTALDSCGGEGVDIVLIGGGSVLTAERDEVESGLLDLLESGVTVASTEPSLFDCLDGRHPYVYDPDASLVAVRFFPDRGYVDCYSLSPSSEGQVMVSLADWMSERSLARWHFTMGPSWEPQIRAVTERDMGDLGSLFIGSYYVADTTSYQTHMASVHTIGFYKDYQTVVSTTEVDHVVGDGYRMLWHAPSGSLYTQGNVTYDRLGPSSSYQDRIIWQHVDMDTDDRTRVYENRLNAVYGTSDWPPSYQQYVTYGIMSYTDGERYDETGSVRVTFMADGTDYVVVMSTMASVPEPASAFR